MCIKLTNQNLYCTYVNEYPQYNFYIPTILDEIYNLQYYLIDLRVEYVFKGKELFH